MDLRRRDFLKLVGLAGTTAAVGGCSEPTRRLIPYIMPDQDIIPGRATWYATTCRECPAGCGLLAKNRDGRVIKVEGNPLHPVNGGKLCPRGQASLHGLYNPDRYQGPLGPGTGGDLQPISWEQGEAQLVRILTEIIRKGRGERIVFLTDLQNGTMSDLTAHWLDEMGSPQGHVIHEPFAYEPLRKATEMVFGIDSLPHYRIDRADFLISFGAGFLETWFSNVEYARQFASFHAPRDGRKNPFIYVGPRLSMTAANADLWIPVAPGGESLFAAGMLRVMVDEDLAPGLDTGQKAALAESLGPWSLKKVSEATGVEEVLIQKIARRFAQAQTPLALADGLPFSGSGVLQTALAAGLLCAVKPSTREAIDLTAESSYGLVSSAERMKELSERMKHGDVDLLLVHGANPVFSLPPSWEFQKAVDAVPWVVSFSSEVSETSSLARLILPAHTPLESWGDYSPRKGVAGLMQPVMGPMFQTRHLGDILIASGKKVRGTEKFPWSDFLGLLQGSWGKRRDETAQDMPFQDFWEKALQRGGLWAEEHGGAAKLSFRVPRIEFPRPGPGSGIESGLRFTAYPTVHLFDGRTANRPWIQELPDPMTQTTWGGWIEIHPDTAERLGIVRGDLLMAQSPHGQLEAPALPIPTVPPGTAAMPIGQGHTRYGRFADGLPGNPLHLLPGGIDPASGGMERPEIIVSLKKLGRAFRIAHTDGSLFQEGRDVVRSIELIDYAKAVESGREPEIDYPLPQGYDPKKDFYPAHTHPDYRWCMVVDLDRCIGCGACVVACYAENNVAIVGREQVVNGREMSWIRVQRYFDDDASGAGWLVMMCQHCDEAPCESVCPIFAPHHSIDGLNNQVYNRCFGTRFCSQNDPYKVRRFNYFTYTRPYPLDWQLNPDVTVRQKGVMEKCSFCIQRIIEAKIKARNEDRKVRDGEFTTACAQTCPTGALTFGNLRDPDSRVSRLIKDPRAYQVFPHLNTKPAAIYLKRITVDV